MDKRILLYNKNLKEKKYLNISQNLTFVGKGKFGEVFSIKDLNIIVKKTYFKTIKKWIPNLTKKNVYNDNFIGNEIKISEKITKYSIKHKIPYFPLFYGFNIINKNNENEKAICLYYEQIKNNITLKNELYHIKNNYILENIFIRLLIAMYILNKKIKLNHDDLNYTNILLVKIKNTLKSNIKYDVYYIDNKPIYIPNIGYNVYIVDFGFSKLKDNNIQECYLFKQHRVRLIIQELCNKNKYFLKKLMTQNNIVEHKDGYKHYLIKLEECENSKNIKLLNLIAIHLMKYNTNLKYFRTSLPNIYFKLHKKLEKSINLCNTDMSKWIFTNFTSFLQKPNKLIINNIIKL